MFCLFYHAVHAYTYTMHTNVCAELYNKLSASDFHFGIPDINWLFCQKSCTHIKCQTSGNPSFISTQFKKVGSDPHGKGYPLGFQNEAW